MLRRPLAGCATALAAIAVIALPAAGPADAAGACTFVAPARIALYAQVTELPADITGDCRPHGYGTWLTAQTSVEYAFASYDDEVDPEGHIFVPDTMSAYGRQPWYPDGAGTHCDATAVARRSAAAAACEDLSQNQPASDIRLGGYASLVGTRRGAQVTFAAGSGGWSPATHRPIPRPYLGGEIQTQYADGSWHRVGNAFRTGSSAKATVTLSIAARRTFRYAVYSTAHYFERASNPITR